MKWRLLILFLLVWIQGISQTRFNPYVPQTPYGTLNNLQTVYICTGTYAYAYHSKSNCSGLTNCKGEIKYTSEDYAVSSLHRKPCCICWSNVQGNCHNDNSNSLSSGGYEGNSSSSNTQATVGLAILVGSVAVLSNDFYIHYTSNFDSNSREIDPNSLSFGFRKTFGESALEYGVTLNSPITKSVYIGGYSNGSYQYPYKDVTKSNVWNYNINYIQKVYTFNRNGDFNILIGPTINYTEDVGFGGILSSQYKLGKVVKLNLRYEFTTQTNRLSLGFIFHYQDKYFWE